MVISIIQYIVHVCNDVCCAGVNIVFDKHHNARLIDYGISKCIDFNTSKLLTEESNSSPGTIYYAAPEIINGEPYTEKIDIWSFGATVIEMITGIK